jgi:hypothetical protein
MNDATLQPSLFPRPKYLGFQGREGAGTPCECGTTAGGGGGEVGELRSSLPVTLVPREVGGESFPDRAVCSEAGDLPVS